MKKQIIILIMAVVLIIAGLSGCLGGDDEGMSELQNFVGTWKPGTLPDGRLITFFSNGTGVYLGILSEWKLEYGKLKIFLENGETPLTFDYKFLDDNQILELTNVDTKPPHVEDFIKLET